MKMQSAGLKYQQPTLDRAQNFMKLFLALP